MQLNKITDINGLSIVLSLFLSIFLLKFSKSSSTKMYNILYLKKLII